MVHPLEVWLQSRVAGRKASQVDLRFGSEFLVLIHDLAQGFGMEAVHRRLAALSVHQAGELFQLLQDVRFEMFMCNICRDMVTNLFFDNGGTNLHIKLSKTHAIMSTNLYYGR